MMKGPSAQPSVPKIRERDKELGGTNVDVRWRVCGNTIRFEWRATLAVVSGFEFGSIRWDHAHHGGRRRWIRCELLGTVVHAVLNSMWADTVGA